MDGLKFRETSIRQIVDESLNNLTLPPIIDVVIANDMLNDAVWMDHRHMVVLLSDLGRNAVEAMPDGGRLIIRLSGDEKLITITMIDTGKGIPEENIPMLFTPFFTTKPVGDGTGLGLAQAYATVKAHHGDIAIASNADPDKGPTGTTVTITVPRKQKFQTRDARVVVHEE